MRSARSKRAPARGLKGKGPLDNGKGWYHLGAQSFDGDGLFEGKRHINI